MAHHPKKTAFLDPPTSAVTSCNGVSNNVSNSGCCSSSAALEPLHTSVQHRTGTLFEGYLAPTPQAGRGLFQWYSGTRYRGEYREHKREGKGKLSWPDGSFYEGHFHDDLREGHGRHMWGDTGQVRSASAWKLIFLLLIIIRHDVTLHVCRSMRANITVTRGMVRGSTGGPTVPPSVARSNRISNMAGASTSLLRGSSLRCVQ